jgi:iron complex outermembrane receptor protein
VPISISVINQQTLSNRNIIYASDLGTYTPSLSVNQRFGPDRASFGIRGFNQDASTSPTVGVYFADVVGIRVQGGGVSGNTVGPGSLMDLQNVQVLKGPQGTLFGRNTTGGAILLVPNKPTDKLEGWIEGEVGNYDSRRLQAVLNVPITSSIRARVSFDRNERKGYLENKSGIGPADYANVDYFAARASLLIDLAPGIENTTIFQYSHSFPHGFAPKIVMCNSKLPSPITNTVGLTSFAACDQIARATARGDGPLTVDVNEPDPFDRVKQWQVINTTTWAISPTVTLKNIASYGEFRENTQENLYGDNFVVSPSTTAINLGTTAAPRIIALPAGAAFRYVELGQSANEYFAAKKAFTEEFQIQGKTDVLSWVAGAYLEQNHPIGFSAGPNSVFLNCTNAAAIQCANPTTIGTISFPQTQHFFNSYGLFAQATYKFTPTLSLTGGIRYTIDNLRAFSENTRVASIGFPTQAQTCSDNLQFNQGFNPTTGAPIAKVVTDPAQCHFQLTNNSRAPTWLINLSYEPSSDLLFYGKYSRGYRQGGINFTSIGLYKWKPEKLDAYEIGAKFSFHAPVSGFLNLAAFYNNLRDLQITGSGISKLPGVASGAAIVNAGKATIKGFEGDASVLIAHSLRLDLGYTYLHSQVNDLVPPTLDPNGPFSSVSIPTSNGSSIPMTPANRLSVTGTYTLPLDDSIGKVSFGVTYTHTDSQIFNGAEPTAIGILPATDLLNLNVSWNKAMGSPIDASFFMTNATNQIYAVGTIGGFASSGVGTLLYAPPRMFGFRLRASFGS